MLVAAAWLWAGGDVVTFFSFLCEGAALLSALLFWVEGAGSGEGARVSSLPGILSGAAAILSAVAWPVLVGTVLFWFRKPVERLVTAAVAIAGQSSKVKIWQVEFDRDVQQQLEATAHEALNREDGGGGVQIGAPIAKGEVEAAAHVRTLVEAAPAGSVRAEIQDSILERMLGFAKEYERTRGALRPGAERTKAMNAIAAKMRTLAYAADMFVDMLANDSESPGKRLAAICILQMVPSMKYVPWLADRMSLESPFLFFHASVALLNTVRKYGAEYHDELKVALDRAMQTIMAFGEKRDGNTVRSLTLALSELECSVEVVGQ